MATLASDESTVPARVLVVDDDPAIRFGLAALLRARGYEVVEAGTFDSALEAISALPDIIVMDLRLPDGDGLELLPRLRKRAPDAIVVVMTGYGSIDLAVRAVKEGAEDFLTKPFEMPALLALLHRALIRRRGARRKTPRPPVAFVPVSDAARRLEDEVERLREADCSMLILGETGTGKSHLARRIHALGSRSGPCVDLNCAGLTRELAESELFGHDRGAFTGAHTTKIGLFEAAHGGTLFLDEIGDIDLQVQPKILKVIEEKRFRRVGDVRERAADVRLLAATHRDLRQRIETGSFRADLFYRISTVTVTTPALRERAADIVPLARHLLGELDARHVALSFEAEKALESYDWPGNIRELRNVLERALLLRHGDVVQVSDLRLGDASRATPTGLVRVDDRRAETLRSMEREHIRRALELEGGRVEAAARRLGVPRSTLYQKLKVFGLAPPRARIKPWNPGEAKGSGAA